MPEIATITAMPEIAICDVQEGDLLFFSRKGPLQTLFWSVGDVWVHTALAVRIDGVIHTGEASTGPEIFSQPLATAIERSDIAAIGRPNVSAECLGVSVSWVKSQIGEPQDYAWDDFLLAAIAALTRKGLPSNMLDELGVAMQQVAAKSDEIGARSRTCASFVYEAFERLEPTCRLPIEMTDTNRFDFFESTSDSNAMTYAEMLELSPVEQDEILANTSLYELLRVDDTAFEGVNGSRVTPGQAGEAVTTAVRIVRAFLQRSSENRTGTLPGCWASPTDLWRSNRLTFKARVARP